MQHCRSLVGRQKCRNRWFQKGTTPRIHSPPSGHRSKKNMQCKHSDRINVTLSRKYKASRLKIPQYPWSRMYSSNHDQDTILLVECVGITSTSKGATPSWKYCLRFCRPLPHFKLSPPIATPHVAHSLPIVTMTTEPELDSDLNPTIVRDCTHYCPRPSSGIASTSTNRSSVRRRSGVYSPNPDASSPTISPSPTPSFRPRLSAQPEDDGAELDHEQPTVILVASSGGSLPAYSPASTGSQFSFEIREDTDPPFEPEELTPVPLSPRHDQSAHPSESDSTRLPSRSHSLERKGSVFRDMLSRRMSFRPFGGPPGLPPKLVPAASRGSRKSAAMSSRSDSVSTQGSIYSASSSTTGSSVDSGRLSVISSIGTTDKFTHKWPKPLSLKNITNEDSGINKGTGLSDAIAALEDGEGLGMDKVDRWTAYKWVILASLLTVFVYGAAGLVCAVKTWFRTWSLADVMYVADGDVLILITLTSAVLIFTSLVGATGAFLNSRPILAIYTLLLWPALVCMLAVGYLSYRRYAFALDQKLNLAWSQYYTPLGRLLIQDSLQCCGYYSPLHDAIPSGTCYLRTPLPGCKGNLYRFERANLTTIWSVTFSLVLLHLFNIVAALLCANHLTTTFGKGITPKRYRLTCVDVKADAEKIRKSIRRGNAVVRPEASRASTRISHREDRRFREPHLR